MKRGPQMALAVAGGYVLGRSKKMKLALMLGGLAAGRRIGGSPADLVAEGSKLLGSSPELGRLADQLRKGLVEAGKSAATAAAARQVDALSDRLRAQSDALTGAAALERDEDSSETSDRSDDTADTADRADTSDRPDESETGTSRDEPGTAARQPTGGSATASRSRAATRSTGSAPRSSTAASRSAAGASGSSGRSAGNTRSTPSRSRTAPGSRDQGGRSQRTGRGARRGESDG